MRNLTQVGFHEDYWTYSFFLIPWKIVFSLFLASFFLSCFAVFEQRLHSAECEIMPKQWTNWAHGSLAHLAQNIFLLLEHLSTAVSLCLHYCNEGVSSSPLKLNLEANLSNWSLTGNALIKFQRTQVTFRAMEILLPLSPDLHLWSISESILLYCWKTALSLTAVMFLGFAAAYLRSKGFQGSTNFAKKMELWVSEEREEACTEQHQSPLLWPTLVENVSTIWKTQGALVLSYLTSDKQVAAQTPVSWKTKKKEENQAILT